MKNSLRNIVTYFGFLGMLVSVFFIPGSASAATLANDGPFAIYSQTFAFPGVSGEATFKVVSLPETDYDYDNIPQIGSSIFTSWEGVRGTSAYFDVIHTGYVDENTDNFQLRFFNQSFCTGTTANPPAEVNFTASFIKPDLVTDPAEELTHTTVRSYDEFRVTWGGGVFRVEIQRYWRKIRLPDGLTAETITPNDYFILLRDNDEDRGIIEEPSPALPVVQTLNYAGRYAPPATRITFGDPLESNVSLRPSRTLVIDDRGETRRYIGNEDFNYYDMVLNVPGENETPDERVCNLRGAQIIPEKVQPCGCLNNNGVLGCGDPEVEYVDPWPPVQFSFFGGSDWKIDSVSEARDEASRASEFLGFDPNVYIERGHGGNPRYGDLLSVSAFINGFASTPTETYFSWCVDGISQQGVVAGGEYITEQRPDQDILDNVDDSGCCNLVQRTPLPGKDVDPADGIDDDWQKRYGFKVTGNIDTPLDFDYDGDAPESDTVPTLSGDGYIANDYIDVEGERIALTPGSFNPVTGDTFVTGDGSFSAAEEYIWGTDPTEYDTDQDGYPDEADVVGVGQYSLQFVSDKKPRQYPSGPDVVGGDRYNIRVKTLGKLEARREETVDGLDEEDQGLDLAEVVRIAVDQAWFFARDEGELFANLTHEPQKPGLNDPIRVEADISESARPEGTIEYAWYATRNIAPENDFAPGGPNNTEIFPPLLNRDIISFDAITDVCPECLPGDELVITTELVDTLSREVAVASTTIDIGITNSLTMYQDCDQDSEDEEVGAAFPTDYCFRSSQVTEQIPVIVSVDILDTIAGITIDDYYFEWTLNGTRQSNNCLGPTGVTSDTGFECGFGTPRMVFTPDRRGTTNDVQVIVYRKDTDQPEDLYTPISSQEVLQLQTVVEVGRPSVTIEIDEGAPPPGQAGYPLNQPLTARAYVEFLEPNPVNDNPDPTIPAADRQKLEFVWLDENGIVIDTQYWNALDQSTVALNATSSGVADLSVVVSSPDYNSAGPGSELIPVEDSISVYFSDAALPAESGLFNRFLAGIREAIPEPIRGIAQSMALFLLVAMILTVPVVYYGKKRA